MRTVPVVALALSLGACATARRPSEPIVTDRPDYTESASVVVTPQVEAGATATSARGSRDVSAGELLLRVPLADRLEGRLNLSSFGTSTSDGVRTRGYEEPEVQVKVALGGRGERAPRTVPTMALIAGTTVPVGSRGFGERVAQPGAKLIAEWELSDRLGLASNLNYSWASDEGRRFGQTSVTASLAAGWTERFGTFFEYYDFLPGGYGAEAVNYGDVGATWQLSPDFQLDARLGARLGGTTRERFVGVGFARRW